MRFDVIVIGGGKSGFAEAMEAVRAGRSCALISEGRSLDRIDYDSFTKAGGTLLMGDSAESVVFDGSRVAYIYTRKLGDTPLEAGLFVLATGRFFGKGLVADMNNVREALMGLDLDFDPDREKWFDSDFFAPQPFMSRGVVADAEGRPLKDGKRIENVRVVGSILSKTVR